jgi:hypothetical protein
VEFALSNYQFDKLFSLYEAVALIPTLELLVRDLQSSVKLLRSQLVKLRGENEPANLSLNLIAARYPELKETATKISAIAQSIEAHGCFLKDVDLGLIDFPWALDEQQVVFLCWQSGEPTIASWHPVEGGFAQRQPLPGTSKPYLN